MSVKYFLQSMLSANIVTEYSMLQIIIVYRTQHDGNNNYGFLDTTDTHTVKIICRVPLV